MIIRQETPNDYDEVYEMVKQAFATTQNSDGTEQDYLNELRKKDYFIPQLSLVAVDNNRIVGQIVLYQMQIICGDKSEVQLVISPLSVHPDYFRKGIGSKLISEGCKCAANYGYKAVFLCGDYAYYSQFGFIPTYQYGIFHTKDTEKNAEWCMAKELKKGFLNDVTGIIDIE